MLSADIVKRVAVSFLGFCFLSNIDSEGKLQKLTGQAVIEL